ncbi:unnamed protein product [Rhizophagus irregularis]|nr:unnamed protein product [Rhizophagus irregularis]
MVTTRELKRVKVMILVITDRSWKKQSQILEHNKNNLRQTRELEKNRFINDALLIASAYESLVISNESMLQAIIESLLPLKYRIPELSIRIGDIYYISLEFKYIPLENEEEFTKKTYNIGLKNIKEQTQTTIGEVLNSGISQLESYMNTISKGRVVDYSSSGIFDERVKIVKSNS